jgi:hypothetical protein
MDDSEHDVLAYMAFPAQDQAAFHESAGAPEQGCQTSCRRRRNLSEHSIVRLIGAMLLEVNDEWQLQHRYMGIEAMGEMLRPVATNETLQLPSRSA